ncbi:MAG: hypothetical protein DMG12_05305 [Acidobacteria bacterium]|nr:MAG: hypothetical protein DMG12_05305 [Acidobacteriota bacterium]
MALLVKLLIAILVAQTPPSVRLYIFDCGTLKSGNPDVLLQRGVTTTDMSVTAYLIVHPRGTLLWETGVIPDDLIQPAGTTEARATAHKRLQSQLAEIGYKPSDITIEKVAAVLRVDGHEKSTRCRPAASGNSMGREHACLRI